MKKIITIITLTAIIFTLSGCNNPPAPGSGEKSKPITNYLSDRGLGFIAIVDELAESDEYIKLCSASPEISDIIKGISQNDYTAPTGIFALENLDKAVTDLLMEGAKLPENIETVVNAKIIAALPSQLNAMNGATTLAAASILNHSESFIYDVLQNITTYLYTYNNEYSFVVTFVPNSDGVVTAYVSVLINDEISKCATKSDIEGLLKGELPITGITITDIKKQ